MKLDALNQDRAQRYATPPSFGGQQKQKNPPERACLLGAIEHWARYGN